MDREVFELLNAFIEHFKAATFICRGCGRIIYPKVLLDKDEICIESGQAEIRGGKGNHLIVKKICENCVRDLSLSSLKWI